MNAVLLLVVALFGVVASQSNDKAQTNRFENAPDLRDTIYLNFRKERQRELKRWMAEATPECKRIIARSSVGLTKRCLPHISDAIHNTKEVQGDIFEMMQNMFSAVLRASTGPGCLDNFVKYRDDLRKKGCETFAIRAEDNIRKLEIGTEIQSVRDYFPEKLRALTDVVSDMRTEGCMGRVDEVASELHNEIRTKCPSSSRLLDAYVKRARTSFF